MLVCTGFRVESLGHRVQALGLGIGSIFHLPLPLQAEASFYIYTHTYSPSKGPKLTFGKEGMKE